ncbi:Methionine aminopeptidase 2 [Savitreella phatthalungensis]
MAAAIQDKLTDLSMTSGKTNDGDLNSDRPLKSSGENPAVDGHDSDSSSDDEVSGTADGVAGAAKKKKKNKKKKKSKKKSGAAQTQTDPPTVGLTKIFTSGVFPEGPTRKRYIRTDDLGADADEDTTVNVKRTSDAESAAVEREKTYASRYNDLRRAAEVHRQVRSYARRTIRPGMTTTAIAELIENGTRALVEADGMASGIAFPTGLSIDDCAAHYTPNKGDTTVVREDNVLKVDFGVHVNGFIVDSAFTLAWQPKYDPLLAAVRAATEAGIKASGADVILAEVGEAVQEVMESYEVELNGKTYGVKSIRNLNGHDIAPYSIHGGKSVPIVKPDPDEAMYQKRMEEGETFAIETFGSTGRGYVVDSGVCSHYALATDTRVLDPGTRGRMLSGVSKFPAAKSVLETIENNFGTLPFCRRYLDRIPTLQQSYLLGLNRLVKAGIVQDYPPLNDEKGSYTAQFEHTIMIKPTGVEVVSRGDDY